MNLQELFKKREKCVIRLREIQANIEKDKRAMTDDEKREARELGDQIDGINLGIKCESSVAFNGQPTKREIGNAISEYMKGCKSKGGISEVAIEREVGANVILTTTTDVNANFPLTVGDMLPSLDANGLIYNKVGIPIETGLVGNYVWPTLEDVKASWADQGAKVSESKLTFGKVSPTPKRMCIVIKIANQVINDGGEKLVNNIKMKIQKAIALKLNENIFTTDTTITVNAGPFAAIAAGTPQTLAQLNTKTKRLAARYMTFVGNLPTYKELLGLKSLAAIKGADLSTAAFIMDEFTKGELESTPRDAGSGIMIIQDGKIAGYPVYCTNELNTAGRTFVGFGAFGYLPCGQFGNVRMTVDPISAAAEDCVQMTINSDWAINVAAGGAFALGVCTETTSGSASGSGSASASGSGSGSASASGSGSGSASGSGA